MKTKAGNKKQIDEKKKDDLPGYPLYPSGEDMYNNLKEETGLRSGKYISKEGTRI